MRAASSKATASILKFEQYTTVGNECIVFAPFGRFKYTFASSVIVFVAEPSVRTLIHPQLGHFVKTNSFLRSWKCIPEEREEKKGV
ncbi:hypothetical protein PoB_005108200 [Plakobranchus ocellatus]|uniref:Uncharacterized protein n=1 Tax=Plakobranchus ocellatus TaxID=259542 RepID=A0AAV4BZP8_9GAST|nr:hypothetical protein PoB_005108200 [Plakobranchus ocellatus]